METLLPPGAPSTLTPMTADGATSGCGPLAPDDPARTTYFNKIGEGDGPSPAAAFVNYPELCPLLGGPNVSFNLPCAWAGGQASMTFAVINGWCENVMRVVHWHDSADEWGYVVRGRIQAYIASPTGQ